LTFTTKGSEYVYLKGKISWVKYITPDPTYNKWSITVHPDEEGMKLCQELVMDRGIKNQFKKDEDGYYMQFSRPAERKIKGKVIGMTPPVVVDAEGNPMDGVAIGNQSDGTIKLELYQHPTPSGGKAWAARWAGLRVDNLIPFNKDTDYPTDEQKEQASGLDEQPKPLF
jgi:hypothetical protein